MKKYKGRLIDLVLLLLWNVIFALILGEIQINTGFDIINVFIVPFILIINSIIITIIYFIRVVDKDISFAKRHIATLILLLICSYYSTQYYVFANTYVNSNFRINYLNDGVLLKEMKSSKSDGNVKFAEYYKFALENKGLNGNIRNREDTSMTIGLFLEILNLISMSAFPLLFIGMKKLDPEKDKDFFEEVLGERTKNI
ncbi:MAG: hypothetical protein N4A76_07495 [Firmicutes bacterium]|jgi:hypothetical protein|nr:hypothetical protein [Bacillota bacterium]